MNLSKKMFFFCMSLFLLSTSILIADDVTIVIGLSLPPYVLSDTDSGMELDIVREALALEGHNVVTKYVPFIRVPMEIEQGKVDAALTVNEASGMKNVFYSDTHITYQNAAITLKKNAYNINNVGDLSSYKMVSFVNAAKYLGEEFAAVSKKSPEYEEINDQNAQVSRLFLGRTDAIVADINIFTYYRKNLKDIDTSAEVTIHEIFPATKYKVGFKSEKLKNSFNNGLKKLRDSGKYDEIIKKYLG